MNHQKTTTRIEEDLNTLFKEYGLQKIVNAEKVKQWVWNAKGKTVMEAVNLFQKKTLRLFPQPKDIDEANRILHVLTDAWNSFPHKALGGKSPNERVQEATKTMPKRDRDDQRMPKVIIGNVEMEWEEYEQMLQEMKKAQKPFKKWDKCTK